MPADHPMTAIQTERFKTVPVSFILIGNLQTSWALIIKWFQRLSLIREGKHHFSGNDVINLGGSKFSGNRNTSVQRIQASSEIIVSVVTYPTLHTARFPCNHSFSLGNLLFTKRKNILFTEHEIDKHKQIVWKGLLHSVKKKAMGKRWRYFPFLTIQNMWAFVWSTVPV